MSQHWDQLLAHFGREAWMPREAAGSKPGKRKLDAFGCGHYGCVMPTQGEGLVCKVSSDPSEAMFIEAALKLGEWPDGIVRYHALLRLDDSHLKRPVFVTWREEAYGLGQMDSTHYAYGEFAKYHRVYLNTARMVREMVTKPAWPEQLTKALPLLDTWAWREVTVEDGMRRQPGYTAPIERYRGPQRLAAALRVCELCFEMMESTAYAYTVGQALKFYFDHGILLADVHTNNIGRVRREDYTDDIYAITDPGHAVFLTAR